MARQGALAGIIVAAGMLAASPGLGAEAGVICTNAGVQYKLGEFACIAACHGKRRLARCDAIAEKASWTYISDVCPSAMINPPWPSDWSELPAVAAMTPRPIIVNMSAIAPDIAPRIVHPRSFDLASR